MRIGVLKEIKKDECRVGLTHSAAAYLAGLGAEVVVQSGAGDRAGSSDADYTDAGAIIVPDAKGVGAVADVVVKVKEPQPGEFDIFQKGQTLYSYVHSETRLPLIEMLLEKRITAIALENVRTDDGRFPLLEPMSVIAGQQGVLLGAAHMRSTRGGAGVSIVRAPGCAPARVIVLGAGPAGEAAARVAASLGAEVTLTELSMGRIKELVPTLPANVSLLHSSDAGIAERIFQADMVVHTTTIPPDSDHHIIDRGMLKKMKRGAVIVDVTANLRGGVETIDRYTSHSDPVWEVDGVVHYAVSNIPSAVAATASRAYENAHLPWLAQIVKKGAVRAMKDDRVLARGLTSIDGRLCWHEAGTMQNIGWDKPEEVLARM